MEYPIENLFRPAVEYVPAIASSSSAILLLLSNQWFFLPDDLAMASAGLLFVHGIVRFRQANYVKRFQRNLTRLPHYIIKTSEIPTSKSRLFLGLGFKWDQSHTQRLALARDPKNKKYISQSALYHRARLLELDHDHENSHAFMQWFTRQTRKHAWWNPVTPLPPVGGDPIIHGLEPNEYKITMDLVERAGHMVILGTTRVGKTRLAEVLITQDIRRGDVVIVFDPKGDADLMIRCYIEATLAGREFFMFHLGHPDVSARYNPIGNFSRTTEVSTRIAGQLPGEGQSAAFKEFVWRFVNVIARARTTLGYRPDYSMIYEDAVNIDKLALEYFTFWLNKKRPDWKNELEEIQLDKTQLQQITKSGRALEAMHIVEYLKANNLHDPIADGLVSILSNDRSYFEKLVSSLYPLLEKLTTGKTAQILSPQYDDLQDSRPIFDWMSVIERGAVVYIGLDSLSDYEVAGAVGNAMFADLTSIAGQIYKFEQGYGLSSAPLKRKISIHADEFNELIGDEFIPLLNKAGGAGFQVTVYTQTWADVEARIGDKAKASQISGNLNTLIMMRVKNKETAEILTNQLPAINLIRAIQASSAADSSDDRDVLSFTSKNEDRISSETAEMLHPADLVQLPKGQAFALIEGGQLYKIRLPLFDPNETHPIPTDLANVATSMKQVYDAHYVDTDDEDFMTMEGKGSGF
ncbi:MAG: type IV conjugative transfer system coupling protein TraD [Methylophilaceae bacterium]|nr:type IV conjugative transfer system coupling protein TraD [Methylophilaceae bacterium]